MYDMADDLASLRCVRLVSRRAGRNLEGVDINSPHSARLRVVVAPCSA